MTFPLCVGGSVRRTFGKRGSGLQNDHMCRTNDMVEWFYGLINELLQQTRFDSRTDPEATLSNYVRLGS